MTIPNTHLKRGASVVAYSGGKAICGPQCAGLLLGQKDILMSAWQASAPHHGPGRDDKVGKEEMLGMLAAVEAWTTRDHARNGRPGCPISIQSLLRYPKSQESKHPSTNQKVSIINPLY
ncbi:MAG: hypothetical protein IPF93_08330 [Saprospiraceae bacterium]|nr:hypothetical protein [Saprospiraceae bacterium]